MITGQRIAVDSEDDQIVIRHPSQPTIEAGSTRCRSYHIGRKHPSRDLTLRTGSQGHSCPKYCQSKTPDHLRSRLEETSLHGFDKSCLHVCMVKVPLSFGRDRVEGIVQGYDLRVIHRQKVGRFCRCAQRLDPTITQGCPHFSESLSQHKTKSRLHNGDYRASSLEAPKARAAGEDANSARCDSCERPRRVFQSPFSGCRWPADG